MIFPSRPWLRRLSRLCLLSIAILVATYALLCVWMNWSGTRALDRTRARLKSESEALDYKALQAPTVDPAKNFFAIGPLKDLALVIDGDTDKGEPGGRRKALVDMTFNPKEGGEPRPGTGNGPRLGTSTDLDEWGEWLRKSTDIAMPKEAGNSAAEIREGLEKAYPLLKELAIAATQRPEAQFTPNDVGRCFPENPRAFYVPHLSALMALARALCVHGQACVTLGDRDASLADMQAIMRCVSAFQKEPLLLSLMVAAACDSHSEALVWKALKAQLLNEQQLLALQSNLQRLDYSDATLQALRSELVFVSNYMRYLEDRNDGEIFKMFTTEIEFEFHEPSNLANAASRVVPSGLVRWNYSTDLEIKLDHLVLPMKQGGLARLCRAAQQLDGILNDMQKHSFRHFDGWMAASSSGAFMGVAQKVVGLETQRRQALLACALERYFLQHKAYPATLTELVPPFLREIPTDVMDGKPLRYRQTDKGRYVIWATGFDGKDDGGKVNADATALVKLYKHDYKGDWAWQYEPVE